MSYDTFEEFSETMIDIMSSGSPFGIAKWHKQAIAKLIEGMDRDSVVEHANLLYSDLDTDDLREGELGVVAELISKLEPSRPKVKASFKINFN